MLCVLCTALHTASCTTHSLHYHVWRWVCIRSAMWLCTSLVEWQCGFVSMSLCTCVVTVQHCTSVVLWKRDSVLVWYCGSVDLAVWAGGEISRMEISGHRGEYNLAHSCAIFLCYLGGDIYTYILSSWATQMDTTFLSIFSESICVSNFGHKLILKWFHSRFLHKHALLGNLIIGKGFKKHQSQKSPAQSMAGDFDVTNFFLGLIPENSANDLWGQITLRARNALSHFT